MYCFTTTFVRITNLFKQRRDTCRNQVSYWFQPSQINVIIIHQCNCYLKFMYATPICVSNMRAYYRNVHETMFCCSFCSIPHFFIWPISSGFNKFPGQFRYSHEGCLVNCSYLCVESMLIFCRGSSKYCAHCVMQSNSHQVYLGKKIITDIPFTKRNLDIKMFKFVFVTIECVLLSFICTNTCSNHWNIIIDLLKNLLLYINVDYKN